MNITEILRKKAEEIEKKEHGYIMVKTTQNKTFHFKVENFNTVNLGRAIIPIKELRIYWGLLGFDKKYGKIDVALHVY